MTNFDKKCPILGTPLIFKTFFIPITEFVSSRRFFEWWFLTKKVGKLVKIQKFCHHRLNHSFFDLMNIPKISICGLFSLPNGTVKVKCLTFSWELFLIRLSLINGVDYQWLRYLIALSGYDTQLIVQSRKTSLKQNKALVTNMLFVCSKVTDYSML